MTAIALLQRDVSHIDKRIVAFQEEAGRSFAAVDKRFDAVDKRFFWLLGVFGAGFALLLSAGGLGFVNLLNRQDAIRIELADRIDRVSERQDMMLQKLDEIAAAVHVKGTAAP